MPLPKTTLVILVSIMIVGCGLFGGGNDPAEYDFSASVNPPEAGSVSPAIETLKEGSTVTVEASANQGWAFSNWTGDQQSGGNPLTFTINSNTNVTASFEDRRSEYALDLTCSNSEDQIHLGLGQDEGASESYDDSFDQEAPPPPPPGALNAYFQINDLNLLKDYRSHFSQPTEWKLQYQIESGEDFKLEWLVTNNTKANGDLTLTDESGSFEVDMFDATSHNVSGTTSGTLFIRYGFE